jgi:hypothetical protein
VYGLASTIHVVCDRFQARITNLGDEGISLSIRPTLLLGDETEVRVPITLDGES